MNTRWPMTKPKTTTHSPGHPKTHPYGKCSFQGADVPTGAEPSQDVTGSPGKWPGGWCLKIQPPSNSTCYLHRHATRRMFFFFPGSTVWHWLTSVPQVLLKILCRFVNCLDEDIWNVVSFKRLWLSFSNAWIDVKLLISLSWVCFKLLRDEHR